MTEPARADPHIIGARLKQASDALVEFHPAAGGGWDVRIHWTEVAAAVLRLADVERLEAVERRAQAMAANNALPSRRYAALEILHGARRPPGRGVRA